MPKGWDLLKLTSAALEVVPRSFLPPMSNFSSCTNYGTVNGSSCACPVGFGGSDCSQPACGGNIFQGANRPLVSSSGGSFPNLTSAGCLCQSGWTGEGCNVCQTAQACQSGFASVNSQSSSTAGLGTSTGLNDTLTCNQQARVFAAGEMSCQVNVSALRMSTSEGPNQSISRIQLCSRFILSTLR